MNKKGFTLVELIATVAILGIIMTIAIPNVLSIVEKNKQEDFIESAKLLISEAEYKVRGISNIELPEEDSHGIVITLNYLNSGNFEDSPYEYDYDLSSFVLIVNENGVYNYYSHLTASNLILANTGQDFSTIDKKTRGINLATIDELNSDNRFDLVRKADEVEINMLDEILESKSITHNGETIKIDQVYN